MERFELPVWLRGSEVTKLADASHIWWSKVEDWLKTPLLQLDADTCHPVVLQLMAYQRDVDRYFSEPDALFRKRVKFAIQNAQDAAYGEGFTRIFERFGVVLAGQIERDPDKDWDIITLVLANGHGLLMSEPELGQFLIRQYGRTCRRYEFLIEDLLQPCFVHMITASINRQTTPLTGPAYVEHNEALSGAVGITVSGMNYQSSKVHHNPIPMLDPLPSHNALFGVYSVDIGQDVCNLPTAIQEHP